MKMEQKKLYMMKNKGGGLNDLLFLIVLKNIQKNGYDLKQGSDKNEMEKSIYKQTREHQKWLET